MENIRIPGINWYGPTGVSPQTAMANMEEEKTFMGPAFVIISLPVSRRLKKRKICRRRRHNVKRVNAKENAGLAVLRYTD